MAQDKSSFIALGMFAFYVVYHIDEQWVGLTGYGHVAGVDKLASLKQWGKRLQT